MTQLPLKSVQEVFDRYFSLKKPIKSKWRVTTMLDRRDGRTYICFYHYHHLLLMYDLRDGVARYQWWEKPTDKRGLDSALIILNQRKQELEKRNIC